MRRILSILAVFSLAAFGAAIDGKWTGQSKVTTKKGEQTFIVTLDAKSDGDKLTGSFTMGAGRRARPVEIKDGKISGDKITFSTTMQNKQSERTLQWQDVLSGEELKLTRQGGRARGLTEITLKK
jgi:hypothetical protein